MKKQITLLTLVMFASIAYDLTAAQQKPKGMTQAQYNKLYRDVDLVLRDAQLAVNMLDKNDKKIEGSIGFRNFLQKKNAAKSKIEQISADRNYGGQGRKLMNRYINLLEGGFGKLQNLAQKNSAALWRNAKAKLKDKGLKDEDINEDFADFIDGSSKDAAAGIGAAGTGVSKAE